GGEGGYRARQELTGLPVVVKGHLQVLEVGIEVVPQVGFHAQRGNARVVPAQVDEDELEQPDEHEQAGHRHELAELVVSDGPVDDVLDHLRDRRRGGEAAELGHAEDDDQAEIRPHVREVALQRQEAQVDLPYGERYTASARMETMPMTSPFSTTDRWRNPLSSMALTTASTSSSGPPRTRSLII